MPSFSSLEIRMDLSTENLSLNLEAIRKFFPYQGQIFDSEQIQQLYAFLRKKKEKETQLSQLDKMEVYTKDIKINSGLNIPLTRLNLTTQLERNERDIQTVIETILANDAFKIELRQLANRNLQLINIKNQLAEALSEEKLSEKIVEEFNTQINQELDRVCSESIDRLTTQEVQTIYTAGISAGNLSYLKDLCQLNEALRVEAENKIADYYMQTAEEQIAIDSQVASAALHKKNNINETGLDYNALFYEENPSLSSLYTADTVDQINELILNGADPHQESKGLEKTPLDYQFSARYEIEQSLNGVNIAKICLKAELKKTLSKKVGRELKNQKKQLKTEATALKHELENNEALVKAQIGALVLRNVDAAVSHYSDIARSEKYQLLWNAHKQEVLEMKHTQLSETCSVYDFLTENLEKLPDLSSKTLKSLVVQFPHYTLLLKMQSDMLDNYRLVQGKGCFIRSINYANKLLKKCYNSSNNNRLEDTMPKDNSIKNLGLVSELKAKFEKRSEKERQQAEATKKRIETPDSASQKMTLINRIRPLQHVNSSQESDSIVKSQIPILQDQKSEYLEKLNQAISENEIDSIDAYHCHLSAIEISMATKINGLESYKAPPLEKKKSIAFQSEALSSKKEKQKQLSAHKLSTARQSYKQLLDQQVGYISSALFSFSYRPQKPKQMKEKEIKSKNNEDKAMKKSRMWN